MPDFTLNFYDVDPLGVITQTIGGTTTWGGPGTAEGVVTITDNESGADGLTLDEATSGGETATGTATVDGDTSTGVSVFADEVWTVRDTVTGEVFQIATLRVNGGDAVGWYTLPEIPLVVGRSYETLAFDSTPNGAAGDPVFTYSDYIGPDGIVSGTSGADDIDDVYTGDAGGDQVDDGTAGGAGGDDNVIEGLGGNDTIDAGVGDDTVDGGADDDSIIGGSGDDSLFGNTGNDTIEGGNGGDTIDGGDDDDDIDGGAGDDSLDGGDGADSLTGGSGSDTIDGGIGDDTIFGDDPDTIRTEVLDWSAQGADGTNVAAGFTQNTGDVDVSVSFANTGNNNPTFNIESSDTQYVEGGEDFDPNSSLFLFGNGDAATSTTSIDFAAATGADVLDEVSDVSFRLNDIDFFAGNHRDVITINAFDANGDPVTVTFTAAGNDTFDDNTITAGDSLENSDDAAGSVLVNIAGPVSQIQIIYSNALDGTQGVNVTDVYFETIPVAAESTDVLSGGDGDDSIDGMAGDDTITGGDGNDTMTGGVGDDVFVLEDGSGADTVTDFDTSDPDGDGIYTDQLDVSNLTDADGNPVNAWDVVVTDDGSGNALLTFPNGETILLQGVSPAEVTGAQLLNAAGVPCFTSGTMIRTNRGDVAIENLKVGDKVLTLDNGVQRIRWIGTRHLDGRALMMQPELKPILIPTGTCGNYAPLCVSPQHGMMLSDEQTGVDQAFARAKHLAEAPGPVRIAKGKKQVTYIHLMFDAHQVIFANGAATESFYPGKCALEMFPDSTVDELAALIPGLQELPAEQVYGPTARQFLKRKDVLNKVTLHRQSLTADAVA